LRTGSSDEYRNIGNAVVHNVNLPASYSHVFVPATQHLADDPRMRAWIDAYSIANPPSPSTVPEGDSANVLWPPMYGPASRGIGVLKRSASYALDAARATNREVNWRNAERGSLGGHPITKLR
jgi:hypothetical protein